MGLNRPDPHFDWALDGTGHDRSQTAYRLIVRHGETTVWDSGKVASEQTQQIAYAGHALVSDRYYAWSVMVWDESDEASDWAETQYFRTGLMQPEDWHASWIARYFVLPVGREAPNDNLYDNRWQARPADHLRRDFSSRTKPVRATVYVTALGLYELHLNGERVGEDVMAPGWTDYHQRVEYQSHDVTALIAAGDNTIGAMLGEGWYSGRVGHNQRRAGNHYGGRPALLCQLHLEYADGRIERIVTDESWTTSQGPVCYSDFLMGELYDARLELDGWAEPGFDASRWQPVEVFSPDPRPPRLEASRAPQVREIVRFPGRVLHRAKTGGYIYDLGQNIAGYCELQLSGKAGDRFTLRHGEMLDGEGELYVANLRHAVATDHYIARGEGRERFKPRFTFHGFHYVELTLPEGISPESVSLTGIAIHNDLKLTGAMRTGSPMVNQLISNIEWSQRDNFLSVPTDCPQRDERYGWSADAQVFWKTAGYVMDVSAFLEKWFEDIAEAQLPDGAFTDVAPSKPLNPYRLTAQPGAPGWGDAPVILAWQHWLRYGDRALIEKHYDRLVAWLKHIADANPDHLRINAVYNNYGDWLSIGPASDRTMVATAYWVHVVDLMARLSDVIGRTDMVAHYVAQAEAVRAAFMKAFVDADGRITGDTQTAYLLALDFSILPPELDARAGQHLLRKLDEADGHLQTGFLGVKHLCPVLSDIGASTRAYDLLFNETYPSWGFSIVQGATTIWERWDGWTEDRGFQSVNMNSFNHYAYGAVGEWLYARVAGIDWDEAAPGYSTICMRPQFDRRLGWVEARYDAPTGRIESQWRIEGDVVTWTIAVPPNCRAAITLPSAPLTLVAGDRPLPVAGKDFALGSGRYTISLSI
ncbi:glycoside hydrolase family 78 protein [Devosia sp. XJ19-1]|uniref:alpha-L-rhamnosidase n=1 Tax=Devosia ureilytica TaxID=2952754 RepID=A0A9Q4AS25_9HYPH|nr:alpha-L-rhamnosidase [Devosia ureilytica]MCP8885138.1 glycoside hydrolase family 78 protein [Devosia ureilytica]MCP8888860.1 glycoside hydrolase family 78 protein [Devosia ureilytica]